MYTRHVELPVLYRRQARMEAEHYNRVSRALKRLDPSIRLRLPGLKTLDLILQGDAWIVVDRVFNDVPVVAWTDFQLQERSGLHEPVPCELRYFHGHAALIRTRVLALMDGLLEEQLGDDEGGHKVLDFPERGA